MIVNHSNIVWWHQSQATPTTQTQYSKFSTPSSPSFPSFSLPLHRSLYIVQWKDAVANGTVAQPAPVTPTPTGDAQALSISDLMAFSGPAPELISARLSMIGFTAALFAELATGESVVRQWAEEPTGVFLTFLTFSVATLIPLLSSTKREAFGPFTPDAEVANGRFAMIGFASLLVIELVKGSALF